MTVVRLAILLTQCHGAAVVRNRKTLASSGFRPGTHGSDALTKMGM